MLRYTLCIIQYQQYDNLMKKEPEISFTLQGIKVEQFAIFEENYDQKEVVDLTTEIEVKADSVNKHIGIFLSAEYEQSKKLLIRLIVSCRFVVSDVSWSVIMNTTEHSLIIPKGFLAHLAMLTVGTTRGILFAKTEGTIFSGFILPTIDVTEMMKEDMKLLFEPKHVETT